MKTIVAFIYADFFFFVVHIVIWFLQTWSFSFVLFFKISLILFLKLMPSEHLKSNRGRTPRLTRVYSTAAGVIGNDRRRPGEGKGLGACDRDAPPRDRVRQTLQSEEVAGEGERAERSEKSRPEMSGSCLRHFESKIEVRKSRRRSEF